MRFLLRRLWPAIGFGASQKWETGLIVIVLADIVLADVACMCRGIVPRPLRLPRLSRSTDRMQIRSPHGFLRN